MVNDNDVLDDYDLDWNAQTNQREWQAAPNDASLAWFVVQATVTHATGVLHSRHRVEMIIHDINNEPVLTTFQQDAVLHDNMYFAADRVLARLVVTRYESDTGARLSFALTGADAGLFRVDDAGTVRFRQHTLIDYETKDEYSFTITATASHRSGDQHAAQDVTLSVADDFDEPALQAFVGVPFAIESLLNPVWLNAFDGRSFVKNIFWFTDSLAIWTYELPSDDDDELVDYWDLSFAQGRSYTPVEADQGRYLHIFAEIFTERSAGKAYLFRLPQPVEIFTVAFQHSPPDAWWELREIPASMAVYSARLVNTHTDTPVWSLDGRDANAFDISTSGQVTFKTDTVLNYEERTSQTAPVEGRYGWLFTVRATVSGQSFDQSVFLPVLNVDIEGTHATNAQNYNREILRGTAADEIIFGLDGADTIYGEKGDDTIWGDAPFASRWAAGTFHLLQSDTIFGGEGADVIYGGFGHDRLIGGPGPDTLDGGPGADTASWQDRTGAVYIDMAGTADGDGFVWVEYDQAFTSLLLNSDRIKSVDNIEGSDFSDIIHGNNGANYLIGRDGADWLVGRGGADVLSGGAGDDILNGGTGNDSLIGGAGTDSRLLGGDGNDVLDGGTGNGNNLYGGPGADRFVLREDDDGSGLSFVQDFSWSDGDRIRVLATSPGNVRIIGEGDSAPDDGNFYIRVSDYKAAGGVWTQLEVVGKDYRLILKDVHYDLITTQTLTSWFDLYTRSGATLYLGLPVPHLLLADDTPAPVPPTAMQLQVNGVATTGATVNETAETAYTKLADLVFTGGGAVNPVILSGTDAALFEVVLNRLYLKSGLSLDADGAKTSYAVTITSAEDTSLTADFTLTLNDISDEAPVITSAATGDALPENAVVPTSQVLYTATATTDLSTDVVVWSLSGGDSALFTIDSQTGEVTFRNAVTPDYEANTDGWHFDVVATVGSLSSAQTVTIAILDRDEVGSLMGQLAPPVTAVKLRAPGVMDPDAGVQVLANSYIWEREGPSDGIAWEVISGQNRREYTPVSADVAYTLRCHIQYDDVHGRHTLTTAPSAFVKGISFAHTAPQDTIELTAIAADDVVYTAQATSTGGGAVTYRLEGADAALFSINTGTGEVTFRTAQTLDYETRSSYSFTVAATDGTYTGHQDVVWNVINATIEGTSNADGRYVNAENGRPDPQFAFPSSSTDVSGDDIISTAAGDDAVNAGGGNDIIWGGSGDDILWGGSGDDILWGGSGDDTLSGAAGRNRLIGGEGEDNFLVLAQQAAPQLAKFTAEHKEKLDAVADVIVDFQKGEDIIQPLFHSRVWVKTLDGDTYIFGNNASTINRAQVLAVLEDFTAPLTDDDFFGVNTITEL